VDHLENLKFVNYAMIVLNLLMAAAVVAAGGLQVFLLYLAGEVAVGAYIAPVCVPVTIGFVLFLMAYMHLQTGVRVVWGGGRSLQTVMAILSMCNCPIGTFYAAYAIWVVWIGEESYREFED